jgi:two-component system response regulator YesN
MMPRILIADDEEIERRALRMILGEAGPGGYEIVEAENGLEALERAREKEFALAFLDIRMPGADGLEAARAIRELRPDLPIVFLTAHDRFEYAREALRLRVEDFLLKPATEAEVLEAARRALGRAGPSETGAPSERIEQTAAWLASEIRSELALGLANGEKYRRWLSLTGRAGEAEAVLSFRVLAPATSAASAWSGKGLGARPLGDAARLAERRIGGGRSLAGAGAEEGLCVWAGDATHPGTAEREGEGEACQAFLRDAREELGFALVAGLALQHPACPISAELLSRSARRAAAVAGADHPLVILRGSAGPVEPGLLQSGKGEGPGRRVACRALEIMDERQADDLSLELAADLVGVSTSHLSRLLGRHFGLGFADCLSRLRIERARTLLAGEGISVKEVASLVGFHDPAYFSRVFRKVTGASPNEYRRLLFPAPAEAVVPSMASVPARQPEQRRAETGSGKKGGS